MECTGCVVETDPSGRELRAHGTAAFPLAAYRDVFPGGSVAWHWHDELEAVVTLGGDSLLRTVQGTVRVGAGGGFFLRSGTLHACGPAPGGEHCEYHSRVFHPRLVGGSEDSVFWQRYLTPLLRGAAGGPVLLSPAVPWQREALAAIERAWQLCRTEEPGFEFAVREELSHLVLDLYRARDALHAPAAGRDTVREDRLKAMLLFIQQHYAEDIRIRHIAQSAAVSESECLRCFRALIGSTPNRYLNQYRLRRAGQLLRGTELKVAEIAEACGFREMSYFARAFRLAYGVAPSEYRRSGDRSPEPGA